MNELENPYFNNNDAYKKLIYALGGADIFSPFESPEEDDGPTVFERVMVAIEQQDGLMPPALAAISFDDERLEEMISDPDMSLDAQKFAGDAIGLTRAVICDELSGCP